jgi:FXSXX-COOH protein
MRNHMSDHVDLATRDLPDLSRSSLRDLRRDGETVLDQALSRILDNDSATTGASAGFQSRI